MAIMLDLETLSTRSNAHILSIGACQFDTATGKLGKTFYLLLDNSGWLEKFHIDPETVRWWLVQSAEARSLITSKARRPLPEALIQFESYMRECGGDNCEVWGDGADFDNVILANAFAAFKKPHPWKYYNSRCFRTFKNLYKPSISWPDAPTEAQAVAWGAELMPGLPADIFTAHSALGDAIRQARALLTVYGHAL